MKHDNFLSTVAGFAGLGRPVETIHFTACHQTGLPLNLPKKAKTLMALDEMLATAPPEVTATSDASDCR